VVPERVGEVGASGVVVVPRVVSHAGGGLLEALEVVNVAKGSLRGLLWRKG